MRRMPWKASFWPGLPQMWLSGDWRGLALGVAAGMLLAVSIVVTLGWTQWVSGPVQLAWWLVLAGIWMAGCAGSMVAAGRVLEAANAPDRDQRFGQALEYYLKESWFETERLLGELLQLDPRDLEARLLLATMLRRARRYEDAVDQLDRLSRLEGAERWRSEIQRERYHLTGATRVEQRTEVEVLTVESPWVDDDDDECFGNPEKAYYTTQTEHREDPPPSYHGGRRTQQDELEDPWQHTDPSPGDVSRPGVTTPGGEFGNDPSPTRMNRENHNTDPAGQAEAA